MNRATQIALYAWNKRNEASRADYYAHPTASCPRHGCDRLADGPVCAIHAADNAATAARQRATRQHKRRAA